MSSSSGGFADPSQRGDNSGGPTGAFGCRRRAVRVKAELAKFNEDFAAVSRDPLPSAPDRTEALQITVGDQATALRSVGGIAGSGAAIGAAVGGATGAAVAAGGEEHLKSPAETRLQFQLSAGVAIP